MPQGQFPTSFQGLPSVAPTLTALMDMWILEVENDYELGLDNEGENSPQALAAACLKAGQAFISELQVFSPPPPDAVMATVLPYRDRILFEAATFVPPQQWNPATYSSNMPGTIAQAMSAAQNAAPPPPPPPVTGPRVGACYQGPSGVVCAPGPGSTLQNTVDGQRYINTGDNKPYDAHVSMGLPGMTQMWYTPAPAGS